MVVAVYDKDIMNDDILGSGELMLESLVASGDSTIKINDPQGKHIGDLVLSIEKKKVACRSLTLENVCLKIKSGNDIIGSSEPYIVGKIGGWSARTEVSEGEEIKFQKSLNFKFSDEKESIFFDFWDLKLIKVLKATIELKTIIFYQ